MEDWKEKATTLGRKLHKLRKKYSEDKQYRRSLEGTIYSLQDQLEDQQQKSVSGINEIQRKYDELQLIYRRSEETSKSSKEELEKTAAALQNEQGIKIALIQKLERHIEDKTDKINALQFQIRELHIKCKSEKSQQRMKNQSTQWNLQQYPLSRIPTPKEVQSMESNISSDDSEYRMSSHIEDESAEFDQEILSQSEQESDTLSSNVVDYKMLYKARRTLECVECDQLFEKHSVFINHMDVEHDVKRPYQCRDCAKCYGTRGKLTSHINNVHAPRYQCGICHKRFGNEAGLKRHSVYHSEERPFKCSQCTSSFKLKGPLTNHMRKIHQKEKRFHCDHCSKGFFYKADFIIHLRVHTGERPFQCTICSKAFSAKSALTIHQRIHTEEQPFQCTVCNKTFTRRAALKIHEVIHRGERPFQCSQCDSAFKLKGHLTTHVRRVHQTEKRFHCDHCSKGFFHKGGLIAHLRVHTGERPFKCSHCDSSFKLKRNLTDHIRIVHHKEKRFYCDHCSKGFFYKRRLSAHLCVHTGEKPFQCTICGRAYTTKGTLTRHKRIHTEERPYEA